MFHTVIKHFAFVIENERKTMLHETHIFDSQKPLLFDHSNNKLLWFSLFIKSFASIFFIKNYKN